MWYTLNSSFGQVGRPGAFSAEPVSLGHSDYKDIRCSCPV